MAIPEAQLEIWSRQGATVTSSACYASVRAALTGPQSRILGRDTEVYLQGSYRNTTNIYGDSDVDVVVQLKSVFQSDVSALDDTQRALQSGAYASATYLWPEFRADVLQTLQEYYGNVRVVPSDRCVKVDTGQGRIKADVVPALKFKKYSYFYSDSAESHQDGIRFFNRNGLPITNFPKQHIANGEAKNAPGRTNGWYKPTVRIFKNARNRLIEDRVIPNDSCPSYSIECIVYNAPDNCFGQIYQDTFARVTDHLWTLPFGNFVCQNELIPLFGTSPVQWNTDPATRFLDSLRNLWINWS